MYESHIVCHFFRHWGYRDGYAAAEAGSKNAPHISMLGNMQNKFDSFFGDMSLTDSTRFQLMELKQDEGGFVKEVMGGKFHRGALFEHLLIDDKCRKLSYLGHVGGYVSNNVIRVDPYFALGLDNSQSALKSNIPNSCFHDFDSYYASWHAANEDGALQVGLNASDFYDYVTCMYQHLKTDAEGVLLVYNKEKNELTPFHGSITELIAELIRAFKMLAKVKTNVNLPDEDAKLIKSSKQVFAYLESLNITSNLSKGGKGPKGGRD